MKPIMEFEEFVKLGVVKKQSPDKSRAEFLVKEAEQNYGYLLKLIKNMGIDNTNANDYITKPCGF